MGTTADEGARRDDSTVERYRKAAEDLFQQLDWCVGYLHGIRKEKIASVIAKNVARPAERHELVVAYPA